MRNSTKQKRVEFKFRKISRQCLIIDGYIVIDEGVSSRDGIKLFVMNCLFCVEYRRINLSTEKLEA